MRHLSICFLLSWFFVCTCLFCVIRFGSGIDWGERCISDLLFLANRHVVVSYWLRLLTRFNATSIRICITALEYKTIHSSWSSMFQIFYRSAMRLIVHPKCWPRAIRLAKVAFFCGCTHIQMGVGQIKLSSPFHNIAYTMDTVFQIPRRLSLLLYGFF